MLSKEQTEALRPGTPVWLVGMPDPGEDAPWRTTASADLPRFLAYGEWAAFLTQREALVWREQQVAALARAEATRLLKVARAAEKRAKAFAK